MRTILLAAALSALASSAASARDPAAARERMVHDQIAARGVTDKAVLAAMRKVPRHEFVPDRLRDEAYNDNPLSIGYGQTISQPYIVALMTELCRLTPGANTLEIGTGSGYQAAILAEITTNVCTIEIIQPLAESAEARLNRLGYTAVKVRFGDGYFGWAERAPFDAIVVTAAADHVPPPLIEQLKAGGRMVIPLGSPFLAQMLVVVEKDAQGKVRTRNITPVRFVPLTRSEKR